jgi:endogenous inhibitor of DNA gyrase (YacG/DUF329 family)
MSEEVFLCKNCGRLYERNITTDDSHKGFCSQTCKNLYEFFGIAHIRGE